MSSEDPAYDDIYIGALMAVYATIKMKTNVLKKK
jgi:hypothetical protein